jgi:catechol 2,3-dioxygenase-like lactoylglutathione lyase family enzyme
MPCEEAKRTMRTEVTVVRADQRVAGSLATVPVVACRFSELVIDCRDPDALARFWSAVLGYEVLSHDDDGAIEIGPAEGFGGAAPTLVLVPVADPTPGKVRLHIDLSPTDRDQDAELQRLLDLGARPAEVGQRGDESWHVLADPEGNAFCLLRSRVNPRGAP